MKTLEKVTWNSPVIQKMPGDMKRNMRKMKSIMKTKTVTTPSTPPVHVVVQGSEDLEGPSGDGGPGGEGEGEEGVIPATMTTLRIMIPGGMMKLAQGTSTKPCIRSTLRVWLTVNPLARVDGPQKSMITGRRVITIGRERKATGACTRRGNSHRKTMKTITEAIMSTVMGGIQTD